MWAVTVVLWAAACMGVVGAVGDFTAAVDTASLAAADGVLAGCSATSTLGMSVWLDSIWVMFMNVVLCSSVFSSTNNNV